MLKQFSIQRKIFFLTGLLVVVAVLMAGIAGGWYNMRTIKSSMIEKSLLDAELMSRFCIMPLEFNYQQRVQDFFEQIPGQHEITNSILYDANGNLFAASITDSSILVKCKPKSELGYIFNHEILTISFPINYQNKFHGTLILQTRTKIKSYKRQILVIMSSICVVLILLTLVLSQKISKIVAQPIVQLKDTIHVISQKKDYNVRVVSNLSDEIGQLYREFNQMLQTVQNHEQQIHTTLNSLNFAQQIAHIGNWRRNLANPKADNWSDEEFRIFGLQTNQNVPPHKSVLELVYFDDLKMVTQAWNDFIEKKAAYNIQFRIIIDDQIKWVHEQGEIVEAEKDKAIEVFGITYDITQQKLQQIELSRHRTNLENLVYERTQKIIELNQQLKTKNDELENAYDELLARKVEIEQQNEAINTTNKKLKNNQLELEDTLDKLKNAQSQLVDSEKMASLGVLTAGIAHEINNPINFIHSGLSGLKNLNALLFEILKSIRNRLQEQTGTEKLYLQLNELEEGYTSLLKTIGTGVKRTVEIIGSLRTFSRLDDDLFTHADINQNLDSTLILLHNQYKNRVEIKKEYGDIPMVYCSPGRLNQVFMNLIINAVQAIPDKGIIKITTSRTDENTVCICIADNGTGIPDKIKPHIFEPFFTTKDVGKGTGLGLSISYSIIKAHKGNIAVESNPEQGSKFTITLPIFQKKP